MVFLVLLIIYGFGMLIYANLADFKSVFPVYKDKITQFISDLLIKLNIIGQTEEFSFSDISFLKLLPTDSIATVLSNSLGSFINLLGNTTVVIFFMLFLIAEAQVFKKRVFAAFGENRANEIMDVVSGINHSIRKYFLVKMLISSITAVLATIIMAIFGLDFFIFVYS